MINRPIRIGLVGAAGAGKSTVAAHLVAAHGFTELTLAGPLKDGLRVMLGLTDEQLGGDRTQKEAIDPRYGVSPRHLMQTLGTEWGRHYVGEDVWIRACLTRASGINGPVVVSDIRFINEGTALQAAGFIICRIERMTNLPVLAHPSECEIRRVPVAEVIGNDGAIVDLLASVDRLMGRIYGGGRP